MKFTKAITVSGALGSHFVFTSDEEKTHWIESELPKLKAEYRNVNISNEWDLPGFELGDTCRVYGEGDKEFVIEDIKCYSPYRYGFLLDSGWYEEVAKCYKKHHQRTHGDYKMTNDDLTTDELIKTLITASETQENLALKFLLLMAASRLEELL